ncbi:hypothetical protein LY78DRAFT_695303, partial [Colletotrichum sublineola]
MDDERHGGHEPANWRSSGIISYGMLLNAYGTAYLTTLDRNFQVTNSEMHVPHFDVLGGNIDLVCRRDPRINRNPAIKRERRQCSRMSAAKSERYPPFFALLIHSRGLNEGWPPGNGASTSQSAVCNMQCMSRYIRHRRWQHMGTPNTGMTTCVKPVIG